MNDAATPPELPLPQCTLTTELLRLRGGPYHSLSYARLRVSEALRQGGGVLNASAADSGAWLAVDHDCDGGRWICIGSYQTIYPKVHETAPPMRCVGSTDHIPGIPREHSVCTSLNGLGKALGVDFLAIAQDYNKKSAVSEVRVFGCTLGSQRVVHYATRDPDYLSRIETDAAGLCIEVARGSKNLPREDYMRPLPGHMRFGDDHDSRLTTCCGILSSRSYILARTGLFGTSRLIQGTHSIKDVGIGILWVRFRDGIVFPTDPGDPSFSFDADGRAYDVDLLPVSGPTAEGTSRTSPKGTLPSLRQETYDEGDIEMMTNKSNFVKELQSHELRRSSEAAKLPLAELDCFMCEGTGKRWVAVKNVYGESAGQEAKIEAELWRENSATNKEKRRRRLRKEKIRGDSGGAASKSSDSEPPTRDFSFFKDEGYAEGIILNPGFETRSTYVVPVGHQRLQHNLRQLTADSSNPSEADSELGTEHVIDEAIAPRALTDCWVCRGTGKALSALPSAMERSIIVDSKVGDEEEDEELCLICWCDPAEFGISVSCTHLFCRECIKGHLTQIQKSGEFPGYCPCCQAAAPAGEEPRYGRITGPAMTFLQRKGLFDKEFQFRFMRKQNEQEELFFACPNKCGNFLVDVDPTYVILDGQVTKKIERCPTCGVGVCVQCHQIVHGGTDAELFKHKCPEGKRGDEEDALENEASIALMKTLGKKCPNCDMFIVKNAGCDVMMCGDKAHGDLRKAIKAGGCGQTFKWSTLEKIQDTITNFEGKRVRCDPPVKYRLEILQKRQEWGIKISDEETKLASIKISDLEVMSTAETHGNGDPVPGYATTPIRMDRVVAAGGDRTALMQAIMLRDPRALLCLIVKAHRANMRIDVEFRFWRDNAEGPPFGKPAEMVIAFIFPQMLVFWHVIKTMCRIFMTIPFCCAERRREIFGNRKTPCCMSTTHSIRIWCYTGIFALLVVLTSTSDPASAAWSVMVPLMICLCQIIIILMWLDGSHLYNSPLTMACALGQPDIVRLLLLHGADPNQTADSKISPVFAAALFGNWTSIDILETTYDQHIGGFEIVHPTHRQETGEDAAREIALKEKNKNWMTHHRLQRRNQNWAYNPNDPEVCYWSPRTCSRCLTCRCRPWPRSELERQRRRPNQGFGWDKQNDRGPATFYKKCFCFGPLVGTIVLIFAALHNRWIIRGHISLFDWEVPGLYTCRMYPNLPNNTWHTIQHVPLGHRGARFATFSDSWLRARNVYFDFRFFREKELWKRPFQFFDGPHGGEKVLVVEAAKEHISGSSLDFLSCLGSQSKGINHVSINGSVRQAGSAVCLGNCLPCNGEVSLFSESCSMSVLRQLGFFPDLESEERRQWLARLVLEKWASRRAKYDDIGCDELLNLDGKAGSCVRTSKHTDHNTCKEYGYDMVVPRSREHWNYLLSKYDRSYFQTIPGVYKPTSGGDFKNVVMNSNAMTPGGYRAIDGGSWWLRDTTYSEPNGNYEANCWLGVRDLSNLDDITFDDNRCSFHTSKYVCAMPHSGHFGMSLPDSELEHVMPHSGHFGMSLPDSELEHVSLDATQKDIDAGFGTCNAPVKAPHPDGKDTCGDENPFFLQGAHTPLFTKMKIEASGAECGNDPKTVTFGLKIRPGARDYLPEFPDDNHTEAVIVHVGRNYILGNDIGCDELLQRDGKAGSCVRTSKHTDHNTCKEYGYDMVVPRSREHWNYLLSKYDRSYFQTIPGVYKPTSGGDFKNVVMNSNAMTPGGYRAIDGGSWWLRDTTYSEPNGNYEANCWLGVRDLSNLDDITFDDNRCSFHTSKYVCNVPSAVPGAAPNKTVVTVFNNLVCPKIFNTSSARFEVSVQGGTTVTVRRMGTHNATGGWSEYLRLPCIGSTGSRTGKQEMACLSTYFHQPAMMTLTGAFDLPPAEEITEVINYSLTRPAIIERGDNFYSGRTENPEESARAKCRCVSLDKSKGISICNSGCGDPNTVCWEGVGCDSSERGCNKDKCTCKPKDYGENMMTFAECAKQCDRVGMQIPSDDAGVQASKGTGCGTDSHAMWIIALGPLPHSDNSGHQEEEDTISPDFPAVVLGSQAQSFMNRSAENVMERRILQGCGWLNLTHVASSGNVKTAPSATSMPLFMYTDSRGWVISNRIIHDLTSDPGPDVVFASNYRSSLVDDSARGPLDYCDGVPVGSDSLATTTVRYMVEPIEPM